MAQAGDLGASSLQDAGVCQSLQIQPQRVHAPSTRLSAITPDRIVSRFNITKLMTTRIIRTAKPLTTG